MSLKIKVKKIVFKNILTNTFGIAFDFAIIQKHTKKISFIFYISIKKNLIFYQLLNLLFIIKYNYHFKKII